MAHVILWRIVDARHAATAYSGEGARAYGGRFNSPGRACVYAASSLSLAMLEVVAHVGTFARLAGRVAVPVDVDESDLDTLAAAMLPAGWDARPHGQASQAVGDAWLASERTLGLRVPSVVVPEETNVLLNPAHPRFARVRVGAARPVHVDERLR